MRYTADDDSVWDGDLVDEFRHGQTWQGVVVPLEVEVYICDLWIVDREKGREFCFDGRFVDWHCV